MRFINIIAALVCGLAATVSSAANLPPVRASLVRDLDTTPSNHGSEPQLFKTLGDRVFFSASTADTGEELYSTNAQGDLRLLGDIRHGPAGSSPEAISRVGDLVIFAADDGLTGRQLWALPLAGGTAVRLTSLGGSWTLPPGTAEEVVALNGRSLLRISSQPNSLWSSDATPAGTFALPQDSGVPLSRVYGGCGLGSAAVLVVAANNSPFSSTVLVRTDGLPGGASILATVLKTGYFRASATMGGRCYFLLDRNNNFNNDAGWDLWRSDGTAAGTSLIASEQDGTPASMVALGGDIYVTDLTVDNHRRLLRVPIGASTPQVVVDMPGLGQSLPGLIAHEGKLVFIAFFHNGTEFQQGLFLSDGSTSGTHRVFPVSVGQALWDTEVFPIGGAVVINAGYWNSVRIDMADGTATEQDHRFIFAGSALLDGIRIGSNRQQGDGEREVWLTDGSAVGTHLLHDVWQETKGSIESGGVATNIGDTLYFTHAYERIGSDNWYRVLWRTDGTEVGTQRLPRSVNPNQSPEIVQRYGAGLLLASRDGWPTRIAYADAALTSTVELDSAWGAPWLQSTNNGLGALYRCGNVGQLCGIGAGGTQVLRGDIYSETSALGEIDGVAIFSLADGRGIWRSDGTVPGTYRLLGGREALVATGKLADLVFNGKMYFISCIDNSACDLTATDGTVAGTTLILPMPIGTLTNAARAGSHLIFGIDGAASPQVWSTDGSAAGTQLLLQRSVSQFASTGELVHITVPCPYCKDSYLVTDGTAAGTRAVALPGVMSASGQFMAALGADVVAFSCKTPSRGEELCLADKDAGNVIALPEIYPGSYSAEPRFIGSTPSALYFSAEDGHHGREPWQLRRLSDAVFANGFD